MIKTALCNISDKDKIKKLWIDLFDDSENFVDWFFENRFHPKYSCCTYDDDILVSAMQSVPMNLKIREISIPSTMICGVSTKKEYRNKGFMHKTFSHYMKQMNDKGIILTTLKAVSIPTYHSVSHLSCTTSAYVTLSKNDADYYKNIFDNNPINKVTKTQIIDVFSNINKLNECYCKFTDLYSAIALRNEKEFLLKMHDYYSDNAQCMAVIQSGIIKGYCIYFKQEGIYCEEFVVSDKDTTDCLIYGLLSQNRNYEKFEIKTSKTVSEYINSSNINIKDQNSMGIVNVQKLLNAMFGKMHKDYVIEVEDAFIQNNNGIFLLNGTKTQKPAHLKISSGQLLRLICGYDSLDNLIRNNNISIYDKAACEDLSKMLPVCDCFIIDEY
ncbi:MAG: GNAT family N-acetyltransferase [Clostridiaceae bacterium]|nr:GNAT family N-acetyltransferase [Clostridiaceae bacterium]